MSYPAQGLIIIQAANSALFEQIGWTIARTLGYEVFLDWTSQPALPGSGRTELIWRGEPHTGAYLASALAGWQEIYFEVTQEQSAQTAGSRWVYVPSLGLKHRSIDVFGNLTIGEDEMRTAIANAGGNALVLHEQLQNLLAQPWENQLEPLRAASADARVVWLYRAS